jgi:hypothetical protein
MASSGQDNQYYRPYDSADESGSDSESASSDSWYSYGMDQHAAPKPGADFPDFRAFAGQIQLRDAAGRNFSSMRDQVAYGTDKIGKYTVYSQYDAPPPDSNWDDRYGRTKFATSDGNVTSLVMVDSRYRDRQAYPQPTLFTLRLPRIYKNVANITLSDVKLLTSFYFFRLSKGNTDITVYEKDRTTLTYEGTVQSTIVKRYITEGSYNIDQLQNEVQLQLNYTPLFFDFPRGFNDFVEEFSASGDFSINFNRPGDYFFNNTTNLWVPNPTVDTITLHFWPTRYAGLTSYSANQALIAYYYPVLNEFLFDEDYENDTLNLAPGIGTYPNVNTIDDVREHILYNFIGISPIPDPVVLAVVNANKPVLNKYRLEHTFRYWLINKYVVSRDTRSQNVFITSPSLNTSLVNLLNQQQAYYLAQVLALYGITGKQYVTLQDTIDKTLAVLQSMYSYTQTRFLQYFGIPWGQYTLDYYANLNYILLLQNGIGATGIASNTSESINQGIVPVSNNLLLSQQTNPHYYWPNMSNLGVDTTFMTNLSTGTSTLNLVYNLSSSNFITNQPIVDPTTGFLYTEYLSKSANVVCPIQSGKYTVFKFRSPVRQTLQVEALPRPTVYRVPAYNVANFDSTINEYFDMGYNFTSPSYPSVKPGYDYPFDNLISTNLTQIPGWTQSNADRTNPAYSWALTIASSIQLYTSSPTLDILTPNKAFYYKFITPQYPIAAANSTFTYSMNLGIQFYPDAFSTSIMSTPTTSMIAFLYHDRAAFQGDMLFSGQETPIFFKASTFITTAQTCNVIPFTTYPSQEYYVILRPTTSNFGASYPRVTPYFNTPIISTQLTYSITGINPETDPAASNFNTLVQTNFNYAQIYDSNWIRLPIQSTLWGENPSFNPINAETGFFITPIGYDTNDVSTDYTDYIPYSSNDPNFSFYPTSNFAMDPVNTFLFQSNVPYNSTSKTFLYAVTAGSSNFVQYPAIKKNYTPTIVNNRQYKINHYYSPNYIPESLINFPLAPGLIGSLSTAQLPYSISTTGGDAIQGYQYATPQSLLQLSRGVLGFNFIPDDGVWDVKRIMFRSAIEDSNNDPNLAIKYFGIYNMSAVLNTNTANLTMSSALVLLSSSRTHTFTSTITDVNFGFDVKGGTYYEFVKDTSFVSLTNTPILGYYQPLAKMSDQPESMYTMIAFDANGTPTTIKALSGSAVPYPFYNKASTASTYLDGTYAYNSTFGVVVPGSVGPSAWPFVGSQSTLFAPPAGNDGSQSEYALSLPIGTTVLNTKQETLPFEDSLYFQSWQTPMTPSRVIASVSNYIMLQDTNFAIYQYTPTQTQRALTTPLWTLTGDEIFPSYENTALVAASGNSSNYYFVGFSNSNFDNTHFTLRIKRYSPVTGSLSIYPLDASFNIPIGGTMMSFTVNNFEQFAFSYKDSANATRIYYNVIQGGPLTSHVIAATSTATISIDPTTSTLYWMPIDIATELGKSFYRWPLTSAFPGTVWQPEGSPVTEWAGLAPVAASNQPSDNDRVYLFTRQAPYTSTVYYTAQWNAAPKTVSTVAIATSIASQVTSLSTGPLGGMWLTAGQQPMVWANRNTEPDLNGLIGAAWQIFYPCQKIVLEKVSNNYSPITDLNYLDYPEYPHSAIFYYRDEAKYLADTNNKWGLESSNNFYVGDPNMSGYYFNSYIFNVPLVKSSDYQFITIRGYTPTESSEVLLRFNLTNLYDFGYLSQLDLISEISSYKVDQSQYNQPYGQILSNFDIAYQQSNSFFGQGLLPNFIGSNLNSSNFQQFSSNYSTIYANYQSNAALLSNINTDVEFRIQTYISTTLKYIIPPALQGRANFKDPILFKLLWKSGLSPQYAALLEDWGLGYNLGYAKVDTPYSTYHRASSFYKILEDYIFLRLNPEYQLNRMDNTYKENFKITRDTTGQIQNFHGKLILNNFNTFSQTFIFNNQPFNPPIGRLDQVYFQWVNIVGDTIDNNDCDWSATMVIQENKATATAGSTIPALPKT